MTPTQEPAAPTEASATPAAATPAIPQAPSVLPPSMGGSYQVEADGTHTLIERTQPRE